MLMMLYKPTATCAGGYPGQKVAGMPSNIHTHPPLSHNNLVQTHSVSFYLLHVLPPHSVSCPTSYPFSSCRQSTLFPSPLRILFPPPRTPSPLCLLPHFVSFFPRANPLCFPPTPCVHLVPSHSVSFFSSFPFKVLLPLICITHMTHRCRYGHDMPEPRSFVIGGDLYTKTFFEYHIGEDDIDWRKWDLFVDVRPPRLSRRLRRPRQALGRI